MKSKIKDRFNKAWKTYDQHAEIQKLVCQRTIELLLQQGNDYSIVADMACGTGNSTVSLVENIHFKKMIAVDWCENLLEVAKNKKPDPRVQMIYSDFNHRIFETAYFDLIFCNMGLQWSTDLEYTLSLFNDYLRDGGSFAFSMPIDDTFHELREGYKSVFYSYNDLGKLFERSGFNLMHYAKFNQTRRFETPIQALRSIKAVGANGCFDGGQSKMKHWTRKDLREVFVDQNHYSLSYHVGIFVLSKIKGES